MAPALIGDRDRILGEESVLQVKAMGTQTVASAPPSPRQRAYVEGPIGSIRRDYLDYVAVFSEGSLRRTLPAYGLPSLENSPVSVVQTADCRHLDDFALRNGL